MEKSWLNVEYLLRKYFSNLAILIEVLSYDYNRRWLSKSKNQLFLFLLINYSITTYTLLSSGDEAMRSYGISGALVILVFLGFVVLNHRWAIVLMGSSYLIAMIDQILVSDGRYLLQIFLICLGALLSYKALRVKIIINRCKTPKKTMAYWYLASRLCSKYGDEDDISKLRTTWVNMSRALAWNEMKRILEREERF